MMSSRVGVVRTVLLVALCAVARSSSLHEAIESNDGPRISTMLNTSDEKSRTLLLSTPDENRLLPLHSAAWHGHLEALAALIEGGAVLDTPSAEHGEMTALHWATGQGHDDVVRRLLDAGSNMEATDSGGRTALHFAAARGYVSILRTLVSAGCALNALTALNVTALQMAAERGFDDAIGVLAVSVISVN